MQLLFKVRFHATNFFSLRYINSIGIPYVWAQNLAGLDFLTAQRDAGQVWETRQLKFNGCKVYDAYPKFPTALNVGSCLVHIGSRRVWRWRGGVGQGRGRQRAGPHQGGEHRPRHQEQTCCQGGPPETGGSFCTACSSLGSTIVLKSD